MIIFSNENIYEVKKSIFIRKFQTFFLSLLNIFFLSWIKFVFNLIKVSFCKVYCYLYPKRLKIKKISKLTILIYSIFAISYNIILYFSKNELSLLFIYLIPLIIILYFILKFLLWIYHIFIGTYQVLDVEVSLTEEYVKYKLPNLLKVYGPTGVGKDTLQAGFCSILSRYFKEKTINEMNEIKNICYFIDFELLDDDLTSNYEKFITYSRRKLYSRFIGTNDNPGLARLRNCYIKKNYTKFDKITPKIFLDDYNFFLKDPINFNSKFTIGNGVNKKHYIDLLIQYIEWFIRINFEKNFLITNQPFIEDIDTGLMARMFTINSIRTKSETIKRKDKATNKIQEIHENIIFPWKNRLVVSETECGTWYLNVGEDIQKIMKQSGMRDFKAFQRHFMCDFYWIQVDQAPERVSKLFRELEHAYAGVISREFIEGGAKENLILSIYLKLLNFLVLKMEMSKYRLENKKDKKTQKIEDLHRLFVASSNEKYIKKEKKLLKSLEAKPLPKRYYKYKRMISELEKEINTNKKNGYIIETVLISKSATNTIATPKDITPLKNVLDPSFKYISYCTQFVFKSCDCERYDTRYMRNLAEERSYNTKVEFMDLPFWPSNFKMTNNELEWMGYEAAKNMFGIKEDAYDNIRFSDKYKDYLNKYKGEI